MILCWKQIPKNAEDTFEHIKTIIKKEKSINKTITDENLDIEDIANQNNPESVNTNFLKDAKSLEKAQQALQKLPQYDGKKIIVYSKIHFYKDGRITLMLQNPVNSKYVDEYQYKNEIWSAPSPVLLSDFYLKSYKDNTVFLDEIKFTDVAKLATIYEKKAKNVEGAEPLNHIYILTWSNKKLRWYPRGVKGSRETFPLNFKNN